MGGSIPTVGGGESRGAPEASGPSSVRAALREVSAGRPVPGIVTRMPDGSRRFAKPAAAFGVLATMASIWWFALRPRRKMKTRGADDEQ
jgi:hypothetical protein